MKKVTTIGALLIGLLVLLLWWRPSYDGDDGEHIVEQGVDREVARTVASSKPTFPGGIRGTVRDESGQPIANARVCAHCAACSRSLPEDFHCVVTGRAGRYTLVDLAAHSYVVSASAAGFKPAVANQGQALAVGDRALDGVDIVLGSNGAAVSGRVLDATGGPVAGAEVRIISKHERQAPVVTYSDAEGLFRAWTKPGRVSIRASAEGYSSLGVLRIAPTQEVEVILTPGGSMSGHVVMQGDAHGVAGARVSAVLSSRGRSFERSTVTDGQGAFDLHGLEPGVYMLSASGRAYRGERTEPVVVVGVGHASADIVIEVGPAAQVSGRVVIGSSQGSSPLPCRQGSVALGPPPPSGGFLPGSPGRAYELPDARTAARTNVFANIEADGTVEFEAVPAGYYSVLVACESHVWRGGPATVDVGGDDVAGLEWQVEPGYGIALRVVDRAGAAVPYAQAFLEFPPADGQVRQSPMRTDEQGHYTYAAELYAGTYRVIPAPPHSGKPQIVELGGAAGMHEVALRLEGDSAIEIQVRDENGEAVDDVDVVAYAARDADAAGPPRSVALARYGVAGALKAVALGGGRYYLGPIGAGEYELNVLDDLNPLYDARRESGGNAVRTVAGTTVQVSLVYPRSLAIAGRVVDADGAPVPDAWVHLDPEESEDVPAHTGGLRAPRSSRLTDGDGGFRFERLISDARFRLRAEMPDGSGAASAEHVAPGTQPTLELQAPGVLRGTVLTAEGKPPPLFMLHWKQRDGGAGRRTFQETGGHFVLDKIAPGELQLQAVAPEGRSPRQAVSLSPGQRVDGVTLRLEPPATAALPGPSRSPGNELSLQ